MSLKDYNNKKVILQFEKLEEPTPENLSFKDKHHFGWYTKNSPSKDYVYFKMDKETIDKLSHLKRYEHPSETRKTLWRFIETRGYDFYGTLTIGERENLEFKLDFILKCQI